MLLEDKVAIVTGAGGSGCGRAIACRFALRGASVVIVDTNEAGMLDTASAIEAEGRVASIFRTDVGNEADVRALFAFAESTYRGVDIVVNDASGAVFPEKSLDRPPYVGVRGWVGIELDQVTDEELAFHLREAWRLIAPPKLQAMGQNRLR